MKKKILLALLATACIAGGAVALAGCNNGDEHTEHTYSTGNDMHFNDTYHYHYCTHSGCNSIADSQPHQTATRTTATCTQAGENVTYCTVDGCGWESAPEPQAALDHDWDEEHPVGTATHLHGATVNCKREGCNETKETDPLPHVYETWTLKDANSHSAVCTNPECANEEPGVKPHKLSESTTTEGNYTVYTCEDCGAELAAVTFNINKREGQTVTPYTDADIEVSLYKMHKEGADDVLFGTFSVDKTNGTVELFVPAGSYWVQYKDKTNGYATFEPTYVTFRAQDAETANAVSTRDIILSEPKQYKVKFLYAPDMTPAEGISVGVRAAYFYNFTHSKSARPMMIETVTVDSEGFATLTLPSGFDAMTCSRMCRLYLSGGDSEYTVPATVDIDGSVANGDTVFNFNKKQLAHTITVLAGGEPAEGVTVKLKNGSDVIAQGETNNEGKFISEVIDNTVRYTVELELPEGLASDWAVSNVAKMTDQTTGAATFNLQATTCYFELNLTSNLAKWTAAEKSGIKVSLKNGSTVVAENLVTDEEGKVKTATKLPMKSGNTQISYTVVIDPDTLPQGIAYDEIKVNATYVNKETNTVTCDVPVREDGIKVQVNVKYAVTVKFYSDEAKTQLVGTVTTGADGIGYCADLVAGTDYYVSFEGENTAGMVLSDNETTVTTNAKGVMAIYVSITADFDLTVKDQDGNALAGATIKFATYNANSSKGYYVTEKAQSGTTDANGLIHISGTKNTIYTINVVGADSKTYFAQTTLRNTEGATTLPVELTVYEYDASTTGNGMGFYQMSSYVGQNVLVTVNNTTRTNVWLQSANLADGKYKIEIINPANVEFNMVIKDSSALAITDSTEFLTINKEGENITSLDYVKAGSNTDFRLEFSGNSSAYVRFLVRITEVTE